MEGTKEGRRPKAHKPERKEGSVHEGRKSGCYTGTRHIGRKLGNRKNRYKEGEISLRKGKKKAYINKE